MLDIQKVDHIGIRVRDKNRAIEFYQSLGFELVRDAGFDQGHPVIMRHSSGVTLNLLGPTSEAKDENVLMDIDKRYAGYTHIALRVGSLSETEEILANLGIEITGRFSFGNHSAVFIRDLDRNVIELNEFAEVKC
tara:strand:+ start:213 stop:617 length:405 start_codon:yes stop_codon:yes gene_type:complete